jgi:hypothetical protein
MDPPIPDLGREMSAPPGELQSQLLLTLSR